MRSTRIQQKLTSHLDSEADQVSRAREGDAKAMRDIHERYSALVFAIVRRFTEDDDVARDWEQDAWISAFRGLRDYRGESRLATWLHRVAVNAAMQGLRRIRRQEAARDELEEDSVESGSRAADPETHLLQRMQLQSAVARLPSRMRAILMMHDVDGFRHEEIAEMLGITDSSSRSQLCKARIRLREYLDEGEQQDEKKHNAP